MQNKSHVFAWCLCVTLFTAGFYAETINPRTEKKPMLKEVNLRLANNRKIIMANDSNISEHLRDVIYQHGSSTSSTYRLRFHIKHVPELPQIMQDLEDARTKINLTLNINGKHLPLSGFTIVDGSYSVINRKAYYDAFIQKDG